MARRSESRGVGWAIIGSLLAIGAGQSGGQKPQPQASLEEQFRSSETRAPAAAAAVVGTVSPLGSMACLLRGHDTSAWVEDAPVPVAVPSADGQAPVLDPEMLANIDDRRPVADAEYNPDEVRAYHYVMLTAKGAPAELLLKGAPTSSEAN
jgi:hypothetical protein